MKYFFRMDQVRKVQRRGCRGGGEKSPAISEDHVLSSDGDAATTLESKAGEAATAKLPAQVRASGSGACEIAQQLLVGLETVRLDFSVRFIPIRSQSVFVEAVAHSLVCPCSIVQAEACNGPRPATPSATIRATILRIFIRLQLYHTPWRGDPAYLKDFQKQKFIPSVPLLRQEMPSPPSETLPSSQSPVRAHTYRSSLISPPQFPRRSALPSPSESTYPACPIRPA